MITSSPCFQFAGSVSDEEAKKIWPAGWKAPRPYIRIVPQPKA